MPTKEHSEPAPNIDWARRAIAIAEVAFASLLTPVMWQGFKRFTAPGQAEVSSGLNFSAGIVTIVVAVCLFLWHRKGFAAYGVSLQGWSDHLKIGLALAVMVIFVFLPMRSGFVRYHGSLQSSYVSWQSPFLLDAAVAFAFLVFFPWIFRFAHRFSTLMPTPVAILLLLSLWTTPLALAYYQHRPMAHMFVVVVGLIVTTGFAEEFFYWGYILPRLNEVWGRPCNFGGIRFGGGLIIASLLFGLIHSLNGVDFLHGHFNLNWGWGLAALVAGSAHGLLREGTGSICAGTVLHGINDIWLLVVIPEILS